jgi:site-specific recombinase XerD
MGQGDGPQLQPAAPSLLAEQPPLPSFQSPSQWLEEVEEQQHSRDIMARRAWGKELQNFFYRYQGKSGKPLGSHSQNNIRAAVLHFFKYHLGNVEDFLFTIGTQDQLREEARQREEETPPSREDIKALYNGCRTARDKALLLTLINGFGISEWIEFARSWHKYKDEIESGTVPIKIDLPYRSKTLWKTKIDSFVYPWDDAVEALQHLLQERKHELGRELTAQDTLFAIYIETPLKVNTIELIVRNMAERTGMHKKIGRNQRLRPYKLGRTFFATEAVNAGVDPAVREFVLLHKTDQFGGTYVQSHKTAKGEELIRRELLKLRPVLNIKSDKGTEQLKQSYFEQTIETLAISKGMDPEEVRKAIIVILALGGDFKKIEAQFRNEALATGNYPHVDPGPRAPPVKIHIGPVITRDMIVARMTPEQIRPAIISWVKSLETAPANGPDQPVT